MLRTPESFFQGKRVFVTGHTGFKGAWMVRLLEQLGATVTGYAREPETTPALHSLLAPAAKSKSVIGDINDSAGMLAALEDSGAEIVLHLAAQALVRRSYADPIETIDTNVVGTAKVLQASLQADCVQRVLVVTSDKCYRNDEQIWPFRESDPMGGADIYSASKGAAEVICAAYQHSFFSSSTKQLATARAGNVIGGGDWSEDRLVPDIVHSALTQTPLQIRSPHAVRPWQHVLDPLYGYLKIVANQDQDTDQQWNLGPYSHESCNVADFVLAFESAWSDYSNKKIQVQMDKAQQPAESVLLRLDTTKANAVLDWHPALSFEQSVRWTAQWYAEVDAGQANAAAQLTDQQITQYLKLQNASTHPIQRAVPNL